MNWIQSMTREFWTRRTRLGKLVLSPWLVLAFSVHYLFEAVDYADRALDR